MSLIKIGIAALISVLFTLSSYASNNLDSSPIGYWKSLDDVTGKPKSIIQIWKTDDDVLMGKVIKIFSKKEREDLIKKNLGKQSIVGLVVLSGLKASQTRWINGKLFDPENGKTYKCTLRLADKGKKLNVHGYIGIPLLGRSQVWERVN